MAFLQWLASTALGQLFQGLFGAAVEAIDRKRAADALREVGQLGQKAADQQEAIAALRRMDEAAARARPPAQEALDAGTF